MRSSLSTASAIVGLFCCWQKKKEEITTRHQAMSDCSPGLTAGVTSRESTYVQQLRERVRVGAEVLLHLRGVHGPAPYTYSSGQNVGENE